VITPRLALVLGSAMLMAATAVAAPPTRRGACCKTDGSCQVVTRRNCTIANGSFRGINKVCTPARCQSVGACQSTNGLCTIRARTRCLNSGGTYSGNGTNCTVYPCTAASGACCTTTTYCRMYNSAQCIEEYGRFLGAGIGCNNIRCSEGDPRACCFDDGSCLMVTQGRCFGLDRSYREGSVTCEIAICNQTPGACCWPGDAGTGTGGGCDLCNINYCTQNAGQWLGEGTGCSAFLCPRLCACDWTGDGILYVEDIFTFMSDFSAGQADYNADGLTNDDDIRDMGECFLHHCR